MDITNDGRDDRDLIKSRIRASGGKVVFEALPNGKVEVAPNTDGMDSNTSTLCWARTSFLAATIQLRIS